MATDEITSPEQLFGLHPGVQIKRHASGFLRIETGEASKLPGLDITALLLNRSGNPGLTIFAQTRGEGVDEQGVSTKIDLLLGEEGSVGLPIATIVGAVPLRSLMSVMGEAVDLLDTYQTLPRKTRAAFDALPDAAAKVSDAMDPEQELVLAGDKPSVMYRAGTTEPPTGTLEVARQIFLPPAAEL